MSLLRAYIGRGNYQRLELRQDGELVAEDAVTRVTFKFGPYCLDTEAESPPAPIALTSNATVVEMQLGLVDNIKPGPYTGKLTVYDNPHPTGIAWTHVPLLVEVWPACE